MEPGFICPCWNENNVTFNLMGRSIYKDECAVSFDTPKTPGGLSVCLMTLLGHGFKNGHAQAYYDKKKYPLVMNIVKTPKQKDAEEKKVTKLAIGMPGGVDAETDKFETSVNVYCFHCKKYLDHTVPQIASHVDSILLAQSASDDQAVGEWELKLEPCEHTLTLD